MHCCHLNTIVSPLLLLFSLFLGCSFLSCTPLAADPPQRTSPETAVLKETDWTAGIIAKEAKPPADSFSVFAAVRTARHGEYDRVVFEFAGTSIPSYHLEYVDQPVRQCGSGKPLFLPGDGWLRIRFSAARMHEQGVSTIEGRDRQLGYPTLLRLTSICDFENIVTWVAALSSPNQYRVMELHNPARLVVDIKH